MKPLAFLTAPLGAIIGGLIGATIWAVIVILTEYEIGIVAWAVGGLVGVGSAIGGGRGILCAVLCAIIALGSMLTGRTAAYYYILGQPETAEMLAADDGMQGDEQFESDTGGVELTKENYLKEVKAALALVKVENDNQLRAFMVAHGYSDATRPGGVTQEEIDEFNIIEAPYLKEMHANRMTFEEWKDYNSFSYESLAESVPMRLIGAVAGTLFSFSLIDILFAFLGVGTAIRLGYAGFGGD